MPKALGPGRLGQGQVWAKSKLFVLKPSGYGGSYLYLKHLDTWFCNWKPIIWKDPAIWTCGHLGQSRFVLRRILKQAWQNSRHAYAKDRRRVVSRMLPLCVGTHTGSIPDATSMCRHAYGWWPKNFGARKSNTFSTKIFRWSKNTHKGSIQDATSMCRHAYG